MNPNVEAKKCSLLAGLFCAVLTLQPLVVQTPVSAKSDATTQSCITDEIINGKKFSVTRLIVRAKPEAVWQVLTDYANAPKVFPQLKKCQILEDHGTTKHVKHQIAPSGMPGTYEYVVEVKETAPKTMEWHRISGSFKEVDGYWKLEPLEGGHSTQVTYSAYVNGGLFLPQPLVRHQIHQDMPNIMSCLKAQSEGATQIAGRPTAHIQ